VPVTRHADDSVSMRIRISLLGGCWLALAASSVLAQPLPNQQPVVEPEDLAAATVAEEPEAAPANWFETRLAIEELDESGDYAAAEALGDRLLELAEAEFGPNSAGLAEAHLLIARVQRKAGNFQDAETSVLDAITIYESAAGPLAPELIDPYLDLGNTYSAAGDFASALSSFGEARTIGRRNFGLLNEDQLEIIELMTDAAEELGQNEEANELQLEALTLVERNHGEDSLEGLEARYRYAAWLRRHRYYEDERRFYYQIERIVDRDFGGDPLMHVRALRARAASYMREGNGDGIGLSGLREAVELLQAMPETPPLLMAEILLEIGDWNVHFSRTGAIGDDYLEAWDWLGRIPEGEALRAEWFGGLTEIEMQSISMRGLSTDPGAPMGFVEIYFTVDTSGRTRDIEITDSFPAGLKDGAVLRQYREARFRPRVENGQYVSVRHARRAQFRYDPAAEE